SQGELGLFEHGVVQLAKGVEHPGPVPVVLVPVGQLPPVDSANELREDRLEIAAGLGRPDEVDEGGSGLEHQAQVLGESVRVAEEQTLERALGQLGVDEGAKG